MSGFRLGRRCGARLVATFFTFFAFLALGTFSVAFFVAFLAPFLIKLFRLGVFEGGIAGRGLGVEVKGQRVKLGWERSGGSG